MQYPSIFNDVLGPVMRGSSSSHTAAAVRIGQILYQLRKPGKCIVDFYFQKDSSLALTYHTQQSDIGLVAGLLGFEAEDERLINAFALLAEAKLTVNFNIIDEVADHPNKYKAVLVNEDKSEYKITALSTGGGMIELIEFQNFKLSEDGGFHLALIIDPWLEKLAAKEDLPANSTLLEAEGKKLLLIRSAQEFGPKEREDLQLLARGEIIYLRPVLPINSQLKPEIPFNNAKSYADYARDNNLSPVEAALAYEMKRSGQSRAELYLRMEKIKQIMREAVSKGIEGTSFSDRILGHQSHMVLAPDFKFLGGNLLKDIIAGITAVMEVKSSLGPIVAAPTAGSCGVIPGTILAAGKELKASEEKILDALFIAGLIGVFIATASTFSAELAGCQAECGAGSGMAAGALAYLMGGDLAEILAAASLALQNILGLVCDPVAGRVEIPCLGKNILGGQNAVAAANMVMAGYDPVIPLDETIGAMDEVGRMIPSALRCTAEAGLATTKTSLLIREELEKHGCWQCPKR